MIRLRAPFIRGTRLAAILAAGISGASGDVITKSRFESSGLFGLGAFKSESESRQAAAMRDDRTRTWFTGAMMKFLSGKEGLPGRSIVRLDKDRMWTLNPKEKEYAEMTFDEYRAAMSRPLEAVQGEGSGKKPVIRSAGEPTLDVVRTGETFSVSGYEGERIIATVRMPYYDSASNRKDTLVVRYDAYFTDDGKLTKPMNDFNAAWAKKLRMDIHKFRGLELLVNYLEKPLAKLGREIAKNGEVPLKFTLVAMQPLSAEDKAELAAREAKQDGKKDMKVPTSVGDAVGEGIGQAFGFLKKKKEAERKEAKAASDAKLGVPEGYFVISSNTFEYTDIQLGSTSPADYEVPKDYKKVENKQQTAAAKDD